jgi:hypothetical protein
MRAELADGRILEFPDGTSPEVVQRTVKNLLAPKQEPQEVQPKAGTLANIGMGALKGASDIGSTLLTPVDYLLNKTGLSDRTNADRRASLKDFFGERADTDSLSFKGGELASAIAGTAGIGGVLGKGVMAAGKILPTVAPYAPKIATALQTGGFRTTPAGFMGPAPALTMGGKAADMALRTAAGGIVGGAAAGMIDPSQADTGAMIGAAMPGGIKVAGAVGSGIKNTAGWVAKNALGASTGAGGNAIGQAFQSGKVGDRALLENMREKVDITDVLGKAKAALNTMRINRGNEYRKSMASVTSDKTVLDLQPIRDAVDGVKSMGMFKGQVIKKNAAGVVDEIAAQIDDWAKLNPREFHTPEGLDALKQAVGDIRDATQFGTPARRAADSVYHAIKDQINKQAPDYAKTMKDYSKASELISEIERSLVGKEKTSADTAMRKLQSLMRNNVNTNYGNRLNLAKELEQQGGASLLPSLAGQALSSPLPRGLQGLAPTGTAIASLANPWLVGAIPFQSPRLMGEAAYGAGRMVGGAGGAVNRLMSNPALAGRQGLLSPAEYLPLLTTVPAVAASR